MELGDRVLLVDDEPLLLSALRRIVERRWPRARVVYASDVGTAEWQLRSTGVRFVVTDMCMRDDARAGMRVVTAAQLAGVPVAVLTAAASEVIDELRARSVLVLEKSGLSSAGFAELLDRALTTA
jgi:DNA-binding NtrC family response regulator